MDLVNLSALYASGGTAVGNATMAGVSLIVSIIVILFLAYAIFRTFEKSKPKVEYIVLLAFLTAIATVGRLIGIAIPGVQLATFIIIMAGVAFDKETGLFVGALTAIVSGIVMGLGFWTPYQMLAWGLIGYLSGLVVSKMDNIIFRVVFGFIMGLVFGWITNIVMFYYVASINLTTIIGIYAASLPIDVAHAICNAVCLLLFYNWLKKILLRTKKRYLNQ